MLALAVGGLALVMTLSSHAARDISKRWTPQPVHLDDRMVAYPTLRPLGRFTSFAALCHGKGVHGVLQHTASGLNLFLVSVAADDAHLFQASLATTVDRDTFVAESEEVIAWYRAHVADRVVVQDRDMLNT